MADFSQAVNKVLDLEGGYQNDPADWGNYNIYDSAGNRSEYGKHLANLRAGTKYGISAVLYSGIMKRQVLPEEIQAITKNRAIALYKALYWERIGADQISNQQVAEITFDTVVNHGPQTGGLLVQKVLNALGANLAEDGVIGPRTRSAINQANPSRFLATLIKIREQFYRELVVRRPTNQKFLTGWLRRLQTWAQGLPAPVAVGSGLSLALMGGIIFAVYKMANDE